MTTHKVTQAVGFITLLPLFFSLGCKSLKHSVDPDTGCHDETELAKHVVQVDPDGFAYDLTVTTNKLITDPEELWGYLQGTIFDEIRTSGTRKIVIFVHGGLNGDGREHFWNDYKNISNAYPIFIVWPSGWRDTYFEHLFLVRQGLKADTAGEKFFSYGTFPLVLLGDLGRSLFRLPLVIANNTRSDLETVSAIRNREGGAAVSNYLAMEYPPMQVAIGDDYTLFSDWCLRGVSYWSTLPIKYIVASFIDGFGKGAWDNMLRRTQQVYPARYRAFTETNLLADTAGPSQSSVQSVRPRSKRQVRRLQTYLAGGLPMFIVELAYLQQELGLEVTLVGHSMGTIVLNRVLRDAEMEFDNIVYMGAACSVQDFSWSVLPYLQAHTNTQFYNLSLHPVAEAGEWQTGWMADLPPRGSLLVWIDNFLSNPVTEQERTFGRWRNLFRADAAGMPIISQFYANEPNLQPRLHFQAFSVGFGNANELRATKFQWNDRPIKKDKTDRIDNPLVHGEFSELPYWLPEFWWNTNIAAPRVHPVQPARDTH